MVGGRGGGMANLTPVPAFHHYGAKRPQINTMENSETQSKKMKNTRKKQRITLRQKAIGSILLVYVLLTSYFLYFTVVDQHHNAEEEMINAAQSKANLISLAISEHLLRKDETFLQAFVEQAINNRDIEYIRIVNSKGNVLAQKGPLPDPSANRDKAPHERRPFSIAQKITALEGPLHGSGHIFDIYVPIVYEGKDVGGFFLGINTRRVNRRLAKATYVGIAFITMTILIGSLLTYLMERRMRGSLKKLIQTTTHMARGDMDQRVNIEIGDEVQELGESFNRMAQALAEKEKELVKARNTMLSMFNGITSGIAYISKDYEILHANRAYVELLKDVTGYSFAKGLKCFALFGQEQDICKKCPGKSAMQNGKPKDLEREIILKNGKRYVFRIHAYPVQDMQENTVGFVEYLMDVTQQRKLEDEVKTYTEHLEEIAQEQTRKLKEAQVHISHQEKIAALGQIAAGVAHEIGNPLSVLSSLVRVLEAGSRNQYPQEKIKVMKDQIDRISKILREMMDFSRPTTHRKSLIHSNQIIQSALGISKYDKRLKGIHVITSLDNEIPALKMNGDKLLQVFLNIIFNAADAMNAEGKLTVTSKLENNSVLVQFEDTGPGIPEHLLSRLFEPFFTTKEVGDGMGLGLSVSFGIMQTMGGMIRASNRKGGGSVFTVEIPLSNSRERRE
jgi:signal transduction histidine kinase